jgi:hypothetical protein
MSMLRTRLALPALVALLITTAAATETAERIDTPRFADADWKLVVLGAYDRLKVVIDEQLKSAPTGARP